MLRPEQMSKVSVTGSKRVIDDVIEAIHGLNLLDLSDYDGSWEGFEGGRSLEGAETINEQLVTVRALESTLGIEDDDAGHTRIIDSDELAAELPELRERINELDDRRSELDSKIRERNEEIETVAPFADLGLDLDLLSGYDSLGVLVGQGDREAVEAALNDAAAINRFAVFSGRDTHAVFAQPTRSSALSSRRCRCLTPRWHRTSMWPRFNRRNRSSKRSDRRSTPNWRRSKPNPPASFWPPKSI